MCSLKRKRHSHLPAPLPSRGHRLVSNISRCMDAQECSLDRTVTRGLSQASEDVWRIPTHFRRIGRLALVCLHAVPTTHPYSPSTRKTPWKLSPTRKANARSRLKKVDAVIEAVRSSGVECAALVCFTGSLASRVVAQVFTGESIGTSQGT